MAIVMQMHWKQMITAQYGKARKALAMETNPPIGAKLHVAWFDNGLHVFDVWDSKKDFEQFVATRLMPAIQTIGVKGKPKVTIGKCHAIFAPNVA
jgi:hypothetical protein